MTHQHLTMNELQIFAQVVTSDHRAEPVWVYEFSTRVRFCPECGRRARQACAVLLPLEWEDTDPSRESSDCISVDAMGDSANLSQEEAEHFGQCARCQMVYREALAISDIEADQQAPAVIRLPVRIDRSWSTEPRYAASSGSPVSQNEPLPKVSFHLLKTGAAMDLHALWGVVWENRIFLILAGSREQLRPWRDKTDLIVSTDTQTSPLSPAPHRFAELLAPDNELDDREAIVLQCDATVVQLAEQPFHVPGLLAEEIRLEHVELPEPDPVAALVAKNLLTRFINCLPPTVEDDADRLTLNFYLRVLLVQERILCEDAARILGMQWLAKDVRRSTENLLGGSHGED